MPIHIAITRKVKPGREAEFQQAVRECFQASFNHKGVLGATMIVPPTSSETGEFGIIRTFTNDKEREDFYASPAFKAWEAKTAPLVEGTSWTYRPLHGLECWFRAAGQPPARWKMALITLVGVYPLNLLIRLAVVPHMKNLPAALSVLIVSTLIVVCLTWLIMPVLTRLFKRWIQPRTTLN